MAGIHNQSIIVQAKKKRKGGGLMKRLQFQTMLIFGEEPMDYLRRWQNRRVLVICDPFMVSSRMVDAVIGPLAGNEVRIFSEIVPDPPVDVVVKGVQVLREFQPEAVIAFGGGSAMDAAKAIRHFAGELDGHRTEFVAIPTTSGTGSEVTSFAVITDKEKGVKYPLVSEALLPDTAILDSALVRSVPRPVVADTGMDVLTHALEAYVSTKANDFTDALAEKAVCLIFDYLLRSYLNAEDREAKEKVHHASTLAGMAFNETSLGLNHALAHVIGGQLGVAHGRANAMLMPHVITYNADLQGFGQGEYSKAAEKYAHVARLAGLGGSTVRISVRNLINAIVRLQKQMEMPVRLSGCQLKRELTAETKVHIAELALLDQCLATNPRQAELNDVLRVLQQIG